MTMEDFVIITQH